MKIKVSQDEAIKAKFMSTIIAINGVLAEAQGDIHMNTSWKPDAVVDRVTRIKNAFNADLLNFINGLQKRKFSPSPELPPATPLKPNLPKPPQNVLIRENDDKPRPKIKTE